jgi:phosphoglucomutase
MLRCPYRLQILAELMRDLKERKNTAAGRAFIGGRFRRDKDAISACALIAETAAWARDHGKSLWELLLDIYAEYGLYREKLVNVVRKGAEGAAEIKKMMEGYRSNPPATIGGSKVVRADDYLTLVSTDTATGKKNPLMLPKSDVLVLPANGTKISCGLRYRTEDQILFQCNFRT